MVSEGLTSDKPSLTLEGLNMGKTFTDVNGQTVEFEKNDIKLDTNSDIVTDKVSAYLAIVGDYRYEISLETYNAIEKYLG